MLRDRTSFCLGEELGSRRLRRSRVPRPNWILLGKSNNRQADGAEHRSKRGRCAEEDSVRGGGNNKLLSTLPGRRVNTASHVATCGSNESAAFPDRNIQLATGYRGLEWSRAFPSRFSTSSDNGTRLDLWDFSRLGVEVDTSDTLLRSNWETLRQCWAVRICAVFFGDPRK